MSVQSTPHMSHHKASGQAIVRLSGKDFYLGPWGSKAARVEYDRVVSEWLAAGRQLPHAPTVAQIIAAFWDFAQKYYRRPDGSTTTEIDNYRQAFRPLRRLYGRIPAADFGPLALKAVREKMIESGWARSNINKQISRLKHAFSWATENELIPPSVYHGLQAVSGLRVGRTDARESKPVEPVAEAHVMQVLPFVACQVGTMLKLQLLTGMRPGEVTAMHGTDIDMTGPVWIYRPAQHKTQHLGHERIVFLGPKAQELLKPFLRADPTAYLFSPAEAESEHRAKRHAERQTPLSCGNRPGTNVKLKPKRTPGTRYTTCSYARAILYGCDAAFPLPEHLRPRLLEEGRKETRAAWMAQLTDNEKAQIKAHRQSVRFHPHQLRHTAATRLRAAYGLEPVQAVLGHRTLTATQIYAEKNVQAAIRLMGEVG
jgi:integrase